MIVNGPYTVWVNYGLEGWKPEDAIDFQAAVKTREEYLSLGNSEVVITKLVQVEVREIE